MRRGFAVLTGLVAVLIVAAAGFAVFRPAYIGVVDIVRRGGDDGVAGAYLSAQYAAGRHDMAGASGHYDRALAVRPHDPHLLRAAVRAHVIAGEVALAEASGAMLLPFLPEAHDARLVLAVGAFAAGRFEEARAHLDAMEDHPITRVLRPYMALWSDFSDNGDVPTDRAMRPSDSVFAPIDYLQTGLLNELAGAPAKARKSYEQGLRMGGLRYLFFTRAYGGFLERQGAGAEARRIYQLYDATHAPHPLIRLALKRVESGAPAPPPIADARQGMAAGFYALAEMLHAESRFASAIFYANLAHHLDGAMDAAVFLTADALAELESRREAARRFDDIKAASPLYAAAQIRRAVMLDRQGATETAIAVFNALLDDRPAHYEALVAFGDLFRRHDRFAEAEAVYDRAVAAIGVERPDVWPLYFARGISRERQGNWRQAEGDLQKARRLSDDAPHVLNYLGYGWIDQGIHLNEGLRIIKLAVRKAPENGYFIDSLGWAYYRLGDYARALHHIERAAERTPTDPVITDHLGDVLWRLGREVEARYQWRKAQGFAPEAALRESLETKLLTGLPPALPRGGTSI